MGDWLFGWVYELLYTLQKSIAYIIDFIREIFLKLVGIETVKINGSEEDLLSHFLLSKGVSNAFWGVFLVGVILLFVFVIIAIVKSELAEGQQKRTKGQIIAKSLQSFLTFLLIPFLLLAGIVLVNTVMSAINGSMSGNLLSGSSQTCLGGQILVTSGYDAYIGPTGERANIEQMFISGQLDYNSLSTVKSYYDLGNMNFFIGIASGLVILVMFVMSAISFIQRIFDIVLLYIVSPASAATIPLDDGQRFKLWREMLISKVLGGYGIVLSMNLFFLIVPQISAISFFDSNLKNGIVQLLFVIGGAFAVTKANMVISQLTGNNAGGQEAQQMLANIQTGAMLGRAVTGTVGAAAGMLIGGTDFLSNRKHGMSFLDNVSTAAHSQRNRHTVLAPTATSDKAAKRTKAQMVGSAVKGATRLATMPVGVLKDVIQGGVITAGKNFVPRMRNVISGSTVVSRADYMNKADKSSTEAASAAGDTTTDTYGSVARNESRRRDESGGESRAGHSGGYEQGG